MPKQQGCPKCKAGGCQVQEDFELLVAAAESDYSECRSDMDFAGLYVISCRLDESEHLTPEQAETRSILHYKLKDAREKRHTSTQF